MKALTLTEYVNKQLKTDSAFVGHDAREQSINNIAEVIVEAKKMAHFTQAELAKKVGTTQSVISRIERGNKAFIPSLETFVRIAAARNRKLPLRMQNQQRA